MTPILRADGAITNAADVDVDDVVHRKVLCPCCGDFLFEMWPEGWDSHAARRCVGLADATDFERKQEFKTRYGFLFR